jgi:hypothetical protein
MNEFPVEFVKVVVEDTRSTDLLRKSGEFL